MTIKQNRIDHFKSLWSENLWGKWGTAVWGILGIFIFVRDEIWQPDLENKWKLINLVPEFSLTVWLILSLIILLFWIYEASYRTLVKLNARLSSYEAASPLEIFFDAQNRQKRYWSLNTVRKEDNTISSQEYLYSVAIRNTGTRTLRDVQVVSELTGELKNSPSVGAFLLTGNNKEDLHPGDVRFVAVLRWPYPAIQPGMLAFESAKWGYGKVKVSVSAVDMQVVVRTFDFDYTQEPMMFDPHDKGGAHSVIDPSTINH